MDRKYSSRRTKCWMDWAIHHYLRYVWQHRMPKVTNHLMVKMKSRLYRMGLHHCHRVRRRRRTIIQDIWPMTYRRFRQLFRFNLEINCWWRRHHHRPRPHHRTIGKWTTTNCRSICSMTMTISTSYRWHRHHFLQHRHKYHHNNNSNNNRQ